MSEDEKALTEALRFYEVATSLVQHLLGDAELSEVQIELLEKYRDCSTNFMLAFPDELLTKLRGIV